MAEPRRRAPQSRQPSAAADAGRQPDPAPARRPRREQDPAQQPGVAQTVYIDESGRRWAVLVPTGHEHEAALGVVLGPPDVREVLPQLPDALALRLHDELFNRGLWSAAQLRGRAHEVQAALQAALRLDVQALLAAYRSGEML